VAASTSLLFTFYASRVHLFGFCKLIDCQFLASPDSCLVWEDAQTLQYSVFFSFWIFVRTTEWSSSVHITLILATPSACSRYPVWSFLLACQRFNAHSFKASSEEQEQERCWHKCWLYVMIPLVVVLRRIPTDLFFPSLSQKYLNNKCKLGSLWVWPESLCLLDVWTPAGKSWVINGMLLSPSSDRNPTE